MKAQAVVLEKPESLAVRALGLADVGCEDVMVDVSWSGISTGTEKLLWSGSMPPFPGLGYPLVPGYEAAGTIVAAGSQAEHRIGETVFVPGASCYGDIKGLFGGASSRLVTNSARALRVAPTLGRDAVLLALAATARHALAGSAGRWPELIVGHGVLGRLLARLVVAEGGAPPVVWETRADRVQGARGYQVVLPGGDTRHDYRYVCDASGDATILDTLVTRVAKGGEILLAGFYPERIGFAFVPAFLREIRLRIAAEWTPADLEAVASMVETGRVSLDDLVTHVASAGEASDAYRAAFEDPACLKMILDWRKLS